MPMRRDVLPSPKHPTGLRVVVETADRDEFQELAGSLRYTMAALLRLMIETAVREPTWVTKKIRKNHREDR